jgi:hypothetical protein
VEAGQAGNAVQLIVFFGICVGYISTYIFRVANKVLELPAMLVAFAQCSSQLIFINSASLYCPLFPGKHLS